MSSRNTLVRSLHDLGAAAWFGGSLMGAVGVNGAAASCAIPTIVPRSPPLDGASGLRSMR